MADGKYFVIRSQLNDLVLDVKDGACGDGQEVTTWSHHGGDNQLWLEDDVAGVIRSKMDESYVLHMTDDKLTVQKCEEGEPMQQWQTANDRLSLRHDRNLVLDICRADDQPGATLCAYGWADQANQRWRFEYLAPVFARIRSELNGRYLDVSGSDTSPGAKVIMWDAGEGDNQLWWEDARGVLRSKLNDFAIDTSGGSAVLMPYDSSNDAQLWVKCGSRIANKRRTNDCLDIDGSNDDNGADVIRYEYAGGDNQRWQFEYV